VFSALRRRYIRSEIALPVCDILRAAWRHRKKGEYKQTCRYNSEKHLFPPSVVI